MRTAAISVNIETMFQEFTQSIKDFFFTGTNQESREIISILFSGMGIIFLTLGIFILILILRLIILKSKQKKFQKKFLENIFQMESFKKEELKINLAGLFKINGIKPDSTSEELELTGKEIRSLAVECWKLGTKIDHHTARTENSKYVSTLVYETALRLGIEKDICIIYFCIAFVYDAGFLDIPGYFFRAEVLNSSERTLLKTHVLRASNYYGFVPEKLKIVFLMASMFHHENANGSGYPEGLIKNEIPQIARIVHIVESYISLTRRRNYHKILEKDSAIQELKNHGQLYDLEIINQLEKVVCK